MTAVDRGRTQRRSQSRPTTSRPRQAKRPQHYARDDFCWDMLGQVPETAAGSEFEDSESSWDEAGARRVSLG